MKICYSILGIRNKYTDVMPFFKDINQIEQIKKSRENVL